jgi:DNA-binding CsgD family transcriptional regulator
VFRETRDIERLSPPVSAPIIGRDLELDLGQMTLDRLVAGSGSVMLISGEPGIGKTRLVEELSALAAGQGALVAWGRVDDADGAPPYWPWIELLGALLEGCGRQLAREALAGDAGALTAILPAITQLVADVKPPPALEPAAARFRLHQAIVDVLQRISAQRPLVLVLDDMHWADISSLELVRFAATRLVAAPILLIVTYRSVDAGDTELLHDVLASLARLAALERIELDGLSEAEVGLFMAQTIGVRPRRSAVAGVHERTEGNPCFVGELARLLQSERLPASADAHPLAGHGHDESAVPIGVRDVVRRRLAPLPSETRDALLLGAVLGREFELATLGACAEMPQLSVADAVEPALAAGLVTASDGARSLRFSHALIRDTVYGQLSGLRRATLHARAATALEQRHGSDPAHVAEIAYHFLQGAPVAGPELGLRWLLDAAAAAQASLAHEQAEVQLRRALGLVELMSEGPVRLESELNVQNRLAALLLHTKGQGAPEFGQACSRARELCLQVGGSDELFGTLFGLALFHVSSGEYQLLAELGEQMLAVGEQPASMAWLLAGHLCVGSAQLHSGAFIAAHANFAEAERLARTLERSSSVTELFGEYPLSIALATTALSSWLIGDDEQAGALSDEAVELGVALGHPITLVDALYSRNKLAVLRGDIAGVIEGADAALAISEEHGTGMFAAWLRTHRGWALCHDGRCDEGVAEMMAGIEADRAGGGRINTTFFLGLLADGVALGGDGERALALVDEALQITGATEEKLYEADLRRRRGELLAAADPARAGEAEAALRSAIALADVQGCAPFRMRAEAALAKHAPRSTSVRAGSIADAWKLSARERELLSLVGLGRTDKQIAAELVISLATVRSHLDRIRDKTGRRRRPELTRLADELGLTAAVAEG